jgi:hypothetical protein
VTCCGIPDGVENAWNWHRGDAPLHTVPPHPSKVEELYARTTTALLRSNTNRQGVESFVGPTHFVPLMATVPWPYTCSFAFTSRDSGLALLAVQSLSQWKRGVVSARSKIGKRHVFPCPENLPLQ